MKISLTKQEYRTLFDLLYIADWVLHAHGAEDRAETPKYTELMQKFMAYAKEMDCEDLVDFDKESGVCYPSHEFETHMDAEGYIEEFENDNFWTGLISRLAERDVILKAKVQELSDLELEERMTAMLEAEEKWTREFEIFGLSRIRSDFGGSLPERFH